MLRAWRRLPVPSMSSSLGDSLGFVRYLSKIWSRALRVGFEAVLEGLLKKLFGKRC
jgi:hypothetical protein